MVAVSLKKKKGKWEEGEGGGGGRGGVGGGGCGGLGAKRGALGPAPGGAAHAAFYHCLVTHAFLLITYR